MVLDHNDLTGTIPTEFGSCIELITLDLSNNHLNGTLPKSLGGLRALGKANLADVRIVGNKPQRFLANYPCFSHVHSKL
jgi:hypothetical protein